MLLVHKSLCQTEFEVERKGSYQKNEKKKVGRTTERDITTKAGVYIWGNNGKIHFPEA
jgi:hypothetical protein